LPPVTVAIPAQSLGSNCTLGPDECSVCPLDHPVACPASLCCPSDHPACCGDGKSCGVDSSACPDGGLELEDAGGDSESAAD
jgi:hypothetical protein